MSAVDIVMPRLQTEEGFRAVSYTDTTGHITIGYGFNVSAGITKYAAGALLEAQATELDQQLTQFTWYAALNDVRKSAIIDIAFNEGIHGLLGFPHMIAALSRADWVTAAQECAVMDPSLDASRYAPLRQLLLAGVS